MSPIELLEVNDMSNSNALGLAVRSISKTYGATRALQNVSFGVERGSLHALVGENGSGKSTLVKILAGVVPGDGEGSIVVGGSSIASGAMNPDVARSHGLHFVHQDPGVFGDMTVADNLYLGSKFPTSGWGHIPRRRQHRLAEEILERFGLDGVRPTDRVSTLSSGRKTMLAIARALKNQNDLNGGVLVLDEPTAALPEREARQLLQSLRAFAALGQTILYVTHRLDEVLEEANSFTAFRNGVHVSTGSTTGLKKSELVEHIIGRSLTEIGAARAPIPATAPVALQIDNLATGRLTDLSLSVRAGEVVGIAGILGSGRSSLLKSMFGAGGVRGGSILVQGKTANVSSPSSAMRSGFGYVPEDRGGEAVFPDLPVRYNLSIATMQDFWRGWRIDRVIETTEAQRIIRNFGIRCQSPEQPISALSGGNQQKAIIGRWLRSQPKLLMLDEPTQGVDVGARADIYALIQEAAQTGMGILAVSSDFEELALLCDRVLVLRHGVIAEELEGDQITVARITELAHASPSPASI
ncbi:MAG: monosaccharide transporter ATP-binding protein family [Thermoleophilia bacterium]|nr:monosaccharide transporter ATP-binding protein family [Thermoleophilia bacterium]